MQTHEAGSEPPWYRQFWPWFLIALPATVVIACIAMFFVASHNADSLVKDNYYQEGLAINRDLELDNNAAQLRLNGDLVFNPDHSVRVTLLGELTAWPPQLQLRFFHPTEKQRDFTLTLQQTAPGDYLAAHDQAIQGRWYIDLSATTPKPWRLTAEIQRQQQHHFTLHSAP